MCIFFSNVYYRVYYSEGSQDPVPNISGGLVGNVVPIVIEAIASLCSAQTSRSRWTSLVVSCFEQNQSQLRGHIIQCRVSLVGKSTSPEKVVADLRGTRFRTQDELMITWLWGCTATTPCSECVQFPARLYTGIVP